MLIIFILLPTTPTTPPKRYPLIWCVFDISMAKDCLVVYLMHSRIQNSKYTMLLVYLMYGETIDKLVTQGLQP